MLLDGVVKSYSQGWLQPPVRAVRGLWLGVDGGECFGLLGTNGAGGPAELRGLASQLPNACSPRPCASPATH